MSVDEDTPMPEGNGDPDCPKCRGRGVIPIEIDGWPGAGTRNCECVFARDLTTNVKRVWSVLLTVESAPTSPLLDLTRRSLWITASNYTLRRHLRHVAFRMGTQWDARVIADATLATAWLATAANVADPDVLTMRESGKRDRPSEHFLTLADLAIPFDLLIIRVGVKAAKNREMPNVLAEAINEREQLGRPTWVVDSPLKPIGPGHICYSDTVAEILDGFQRVVLPDENTSTAKSAVTYTPHPSGESNPAPYASKSLGPQARPVASSRAPPPAPLDTADDCSIDSLIVSAVDPKLPAAPPGIPGELAVKVIGADAEIPDTAFDADEAVQNYPSVEDLRTNGRPSWLKDTALTTDERKQRKERKAKKGWKGGAR